jgi:hypothetical protein
VTEPAAPPPGPVTWLILAYRPPASHGLKTTIRRRLTAAGAVFPVHAVAVAPASPAAERAFRRIRRTIGQAGGSAQVLRAEAIEGAPDLVASFNQAREEEYAEIIAGCASLVAELGALTATGRFRYPDLGDKDAELKRLCMRNDMVRARDTLGAANAGPALSCLARCRAAVDAFAARVYRTDSAHGD